MLGRAIRLSSWRCRTWRGRDGIARGRWRRYVLPDGSMLRVSVGEVFGRRAFRLGMVSADD